MALRSNSHLVGVDGLAVLIHLITKSEIKAFAELTGDMNPIHLDDEYAKNTTFKQVIVHGAFLISLISKVIAEKNPGPGSIWLNQSCRFNRPVHIGDEIKVIVETKSIKKTTISTDSMNVLMNKYWLRTYIENQENKIVFEGNAEVLR